MLAERVSLSKLPEERLSRLVVRPSGFSEECREAVNDGAALTALAPWIRSHKTRYDIVWTAAAGRGRRCGCGLLAPRRVCNGVTEVAENLLIRSRIPRVRWYGSRP
jgi:hypothetical protein